MSNDNYELIAHRISEFSFIESNSKIKEITLKIDIDAQISIDAQNNKGILKLCVSLSNKEEPEDKFKMFVEFYAKYKFPNIIDNDIDQSTKDVCFTETYNVLCKKIDIICGQFNMSGFKMPLIDES